MKKCIVIAALLILNLGLFAQLESLSSGDIIYTNPVNGSVYNNPETTITIGFLKNTNTKLLNKCNIRMTNSSQQEITGDIVQPKHQSLLIFRPKERLNPKEKYEVNILFEKKMIYHFDFLIDNNSEIVTETTNETFNLPYFKPDKSEQIKAQRYREKYDLPDGFPAFEIFNSNHPGGGYYLLNRMSQNPNIKMYLIIMDTLGFPVFYKETPPTHAIYNLQMQETSYLSYWDQLDTLFHEIDSSYNIINSYGAKNGYDADGHDFRLRTDSTYWLMIYDTRIVDMSQIVPGGQVNAAVTGLIIQHVDNEGNVLFEWKSWDHFQITDADPGLVNLTTAGIDYVHGNALDIDDDGNIVISSRNMSEITKIDVSSGNIIWRWGGSQNQFEFIDDTTVFSGQHNIRSLGDNIYSLYDNGNTRFPRFSRGLRYQIDPEALTATLLTDYNHFDSSVFSPFMGSFFSSDDQGHVTGWSFNFQRYVLTDYDSLGNIVLEVRSVDTAGFMSYRVEKYDWETNAISFNQDAFFIDDVKVGDTVIIEFELKNNLSSVFNLNGFNSSDSAFQLVEELPIEIGPGGLVSLHLQFIPVEERTYTAAISLFTDNQQFRNAKQFRVQTSLVTNVDNQTARLTDIRISPNPARTRVHIASIGNTEIKSVAVYNLFGQLLKLDNSKPGKAFNLDVRDLKAGIYLLKIETASGFTTKQIVVN